jgi:hypothetical protein
MAMRKFFLLMLLASAASPAVAQSENGPRGHRAEHGQSDSDNEHQDRPGRQQRGSPQNDSGNRPDTGNRHAPGTGASGNVEPSHVDRVQHGPANVAATPVEPARRPEDSVRTLHPNSGDSLERRTRKADSHPTLPDRPESERRHGATETGNMNRNFRGRGRDHDGPDQPATIESRNVRNAPNVQEGGGLVQPRRDTPRVVQPTERRVSRRPVFGTEPPAPRTAGTVQAHPSRRWSTDWRHDHRYDWNNWRRHHRNKFHLGLYYDPFGWNYFRYGLGWRMWPSYYGNSFWLNDPWQYRLPPAYGPYRWVRYHYDAVLVNIYTGQIGDIVYDFFW